MIKLSQLPLAQHLVIAFTCASRNGTIDDQQAAQYGVGQLLKELVEAGYLTLWKHGRLDSRYHRTQLGEDYAHLFCSEIELYQETLELLAQQ